MSPEAVVDPAERLARALTEVQGGRYESWLRRAPNILSALAAPLPVIEAAAPHPDMPHEFSTVCRLCGERGFLHVALITDLDVVKIEPRPKAEQEASDA